MAGGKFMFIDTKAKTYILGTRVIKNGKRHDYSITYTSDGKSEAGLWVEWEKQKKWSV